MGVGPATDPCGFGAKPTGRATSTLQGLPTDISSRVTVPAQNRSQIGATGTIEPVYRKRPARKKARPNRRKLSPACVSSHRGGLSVTTDGSPGSGTVSRSHASTRSCPGEALITRTSCFLKFVGKLRRRVCEELTCASSEGHLVDSLPRVPTISSGISSSRSSDSGYALGAP